MLVDELLEAQLTMLKDHHDWNAVALFRLEHKSGDAIGNMVCDSGTAELFARKIAGAALPEHWPTIAAVHSVASVTPEVFAAELYQAYKAKSGEGFLCWPNLTNEEKAPWIAAALRALSIIDQLREASK